MKMIMMPGFVNMTSSSSFFNVIVFSLSSFVSKFHFNIITGFGVMTFFVYKGLTRNPEIGNTRIWILPYNLGLGVAHKRKVIVNYSNKKLMKAVKVHGYSFFWLLSY